MSTKLPAVKGVNQEQKWTLFSSSQSLSAALNDPACREYDFFTKTWGSYFLPNVPLPFPPTDLPKIELADFQRFIKDTAQGRKIHRAVLRQLRAEGHQLPESPKSKSRPAESPRIPVRSLHLQLLQDGQMYDLSEVPKVFMRSDFSLGQLATFQEVIPLSLSLSPYVGRRRLTAKDWEAHQNTQHSAKLLHEKLSHYLDIVEVHLAHEIAQKSDIFFDTLAAQQKMQKHISHLRHDVMELRHCVRQADLDVSVKPLHLLKLCVRRRRYHSVYQRLKLIATVQQTQPTIQLLLRNSDFVGALDLIATTQDVLQQELQGIRSFRHLGSQLEEMAKAIERLMEADFVHFAQQQVQHRLTMLKMEQTFSSEGCTLSQNVTMDRSSDTEERLVSITYGLLRQGKFGFVATLREGLLGPLKLKAREIVRTCLTNQMSGTSGEEPTSFAVQIRALSCSSWLALMNNIFNAMLIELKAIKDCLDVISGVIRGVSEEADATNLSVDNGSDSEQLQQTSGLLEPAKSASASLSSDAIPTFLPSADDVYSAAESFDFKSAEFEVEDRLDQLVLEDELSDVRIHEGAMAAGGVSIIEGTMATRGTLTTGADSTREITVGSRGTETGEKDAAKTASGGRTEEGSTNKEAGIDHNSAVFIDRCKHLLRDCHEIVATSCDLVHGRCAKVLGVRIKAGLLDDIASSDFVILVRHIERFVISSVNITGRQCTQLRTAVLVQAKVFLDQFHNIRKNKLSMLLEAERWKQTDVPAEIQALVSCIEANIPYPPSNMSDGHSQAPAKYLIVHSQKCAVVGVIPLLVKLLHEYCQCANDLPMLITDVLGKLIELLKLFNEQTCGLVLGAGAMKLQLKTITSRHLGLVSRCLHAVMLLIPDVKKLFEQKMLPQQHPLLLPFDAVLKDFAVHFKQIQEKLVDIMGDLIKRQLVKWEAKYPTPSPTMTTIVKHILKLHEALFDILPADQLSDVFRGVEQAFKEHLRAQLVLQGVTNNGSTQHGIVNSELQHFKTALSSLGNITAFGNSLFDVWSINR